MVDTWEHLPPKIAHAIFIWTTPSVHQFRRSAAIITALALPYNSPQFAFLEFLEDPTAVPPTIIQLVANQCNITNPDCLVDYRDTPQRWAHTVEIRTQYGYREFVDPIARFRLTRWLYALCWTGTERPSVLFERAVTWLLVHKVLLPGCSVLERFIAKLRVRVEARLWRLLGHGITTEQWARLERLLTIPSDSKRASWLERLRSSPVMISGPALVKAIERLQNIRDLGITLPTATHIPSSRIASLARFANSSKVTALTRLPLARRMATLVAFAHCMEMTAHDDVLAIFEVLLHEVLRALFYERLTSRLATAARRAGFVHGVATPFEIAIKRTAQIRLDTQFPGVAMAYSWPSKGWVLEYLADYDRVDGATTRLEQVIRELLQATPAATRVHLVGHSLWCLITARTIEQLSTEGRGRIGEVILGAPDISRLDYPRLATALRQRARRVTVYAAPADRALRVSAWLRAWIGRVGSNVAYALHPGIDAIDASAIVRQSWFGDRHSYIFEAPLVGELRAVLDGDPQLRAWLERRRNGDVDYYVIRP